MDIHLEIRSGPWKQEFRVGGGVWQQLPVSPGYEEATGHFLYNLRNKEGVPLIWGPSPLALLSSWTFISSPVYLELSTEVLDPGLKTVRIHCVPDAGWEEQIWD